MDFCVDPVFHSHRLKANADQWEANWLPFDSQKLNEAIGHEVGFGAAI
jgi:hypothetical protein